MTSIYGQAAVSAESPEGEETIYLVRRVPARAAEWQAVSCTKPDGTEYRVSESPAGVWSCSCPAATVGQHRGGRWRKVGEQAVCKHVRAVLDWLLE